MTCRTRNLADGAQRDALRLSPKHVAGWLPRHTRGPGPRGGDAAKQPCAAGMPGS